MNVNGDDLELQISATMAKANAAIDGLVRRLDTFSDKLTNINTSSLNSISESLDKIAKASQSAQAIGDMSKNIAKLGNKSVQNAVNNMPQLANSVRDMLTEISKAPRITTSTIQMTNALANLASQGSKVGSASKTVVNGLNNTSSAMNRAYKSTRSLASAFGTLYANFFWVVRAGKKLWDSIESTTDYIEAFNYSTVAFGKIASEWDKDWENYGDKNARNYSNSFITRINESMKSLSGLQIEMSNDFSEGILSSTNMKNLSLNIREVTQSASQLASVTNSVGQTGEVSLVTAQSFTRLASDMSSLFNVDYNSVMTNLQSGLIGQSRALYKYGIDITNTTLQTYAFKHGIEKAVSEMTQAEKMQLRLIAILDQSKVSWGDLANTINSPNNMIRQFKNNLSELSLVLGQLFIPLLEKVLPVINGITIAFKNLLTSVAGFFGVTINLSEFGQGFMESEEGIDGVVEGLENATAAAKKFRNSTRAFDELNVINTQSSGADTGGVGVGNIDLTSDILKATEEYQKVWDEAFANMENKAQEFAEKIEKALRKILPLVIGIGTGFLVWKIAPTLVNGLKVISGTIGAINAGFGKLVGLNIWQNIFGKIPAGMQQFLAWGAVIGVIVARFSDLYLNSEKFRIGIERIGEIFSGVFEVIGTILSEIGTAIWNIVDGFAEWLGIDLSFLEDWLASISEFVKSLDLDFADLAITIGGIALMFVPGGQLFGGALLGFEALSVGIRALGGISDEEWENIKAGWAETWNNVKEKTSEFIEKVKTFFIDLWEGIKNVWNTVSTWFNEHVIEPIVSFFSGLVTRIGQFFEGCWIIIQAIWIIVSDWFNEHVIEPLVEFFAPIVKTISTFFSDLWDEIVEIWNVVAGWFDKNIIQPVSDAFESACEAIAEFFEGLWRGIEKGVVSAMNAVIGGIEKGINFIIKGINSIIGGFNKIVSWAAKVAEVDWGGVDLISEVKLTRINAYATGGFPEDGLFMANRNELVGQFSNGRTAVANNKQITEGIADAVYPAVYNAVSEALRNSGSSSAPEIRVFVGDRELTDIAIDGINERTRRSGKTPIQLAW